LKKDLKIATIIFPTAVGSVTAVKMPNKIADESKNEVEQEILEDFIKQYKIQINEKLSQRNREIEISAVTS